MNILDDRSRILVVYLCVYYLTDQLLQLVLCEYCDIEITDELWPKQWYLNKSDTDSYDMNVLPAWRNCINGTGITVGVVDKGVQEHFDLNVNRTLSFGDYSSGDVNSFKHGTRVAGVIGALKNGNLSVGIAFGAEIADIRIASEQVFETFDVAAFTHHMEIIDIYSCSFANFHTGTKIYPLLEEQENAFKRGTTLGRKGKGSVYVFATGNSGGNESSISIDYCAYDRLVTNRYVISVAGIQYDLSKVPTGEACSAMLVAAFTSKGGAQDHKLVTTDIGNTSTEYFNLNSAATPMVSGAIALALNANPDLSYRDIMHLLVQTSRSDLPEFNSGNYFMKNAANLSVSSYFGFGLLDISELVNEGVNWTHVPELKTCSASVKSSMPLHSPCHIVQVDSCNITYLEHTEVSLQVRHTKAGKVKWDLISPYETRSTVLPGRGLDSATYMNHTTLTVQMWGENPNGYWRLQPSPVFGSNLDGGMLESFTITLYGFTCVPPFDCLKTAVDPSMCTMSVPETTTQATPETTTQATPDVKTDKRNDYLWFILIPVILIVSVIIYIAYKKKCLCFKKELRTDIQEDTEQGIPLKT